MPSDQRLHPSSILFGLGSALRAFLLPALVLVLTSGRSSDAPTGPGWLDPGRWMTQWIPGDVEIANWQFWLLLFLIPSTIVSVARYLSFRLHYEGTELVIRSGIIFRNERHVPYLRIQNLDAVRNVAHRLLGVAEVRIETGGGQAPEATISVLHETVVEEMRRGRHPKDAGLEALKRVQKNTVEKRLLNSRGLPNFGLNFYIVNKKGEYAGVSMYEANYAVCTEKGPETVPTTPLLEGKASG